MQLDENEVYEHIWLSGAGFKQKLYARLFNTETEQSRIKSFLVDNYIPPLFIETETDSKFKSFNHGKNLEKVPLAKIKDHKQAIKQVNNERSSLKAAGVSELPQIYGSKSIPFEFIRQHWSNSLECNHDIPVLFIDIETRSKNGFPMAHLAEQEIVLIQCYFTTAEQYIVLGTKEWDNPPSHVKYIKLNSEIELLNAFIKILRKMNPGIITGFNSNGFDLPYIYHRMEKLDLDPNMLSPINKATNKESRYDARTGGFIETPIKGKSADEMEYFGIIIEGVICLDYRDLVLKYSFLKLPNYKLDTVAKACGLSGKHKRVSFEYMDFDSSYSAKKIKLLITDKEEVPKDELELWTLINNRNVLKKDSEEYLYNEEKLKHAVFQEFCTYGITDVEILVNIDKSARLIETVKIIAYICGVNVDDVQGTLKQWQNYMYTNNSKDNIILSLHQQDVDKNCTYRAGFTASTPGLYNYVFSIDAAGMFPNIFQFANIGADTIISEDNLSQELRDIRLKYLNFYTQENFGDDNGILNIKYGARDANNTIEERNFINHIINSPEIGEYCKKHNVSVTPNGYFYSLEKESSSAKAMRENIGMRYDAKYKAIELAKKAEDIKNDIRTLDAAGVMKEELLNKLVNKLGKIKSAEQYQGTLSNSLKVFLNSFYGAGALRTCTYSNGKITNASVTTTGRMWILALGMAVSNAIRADIGEEPSCELTEVVQSDTDSMYFCLDRLMKKRFPDLSGDKAIKFIQGYYTKRLEPVIVDTMNHLHKQFNYTRREVMQMDQEVITDSFVSIASKRYFCRVRVSDEVLLSEPKEKVVGITLVSSSTPTAIQEVLKPILTYILNHDQLGLQRYISARKKEFTELPIDGIAGSSGVSNVNNFFFTDKNKKIIDNWRDGYRVSKLNDEGVVVTAPSNSKGAVVFNTLVDELGVTDRFEKIMNSDKVKFIYLQVPNIITGSHNYIAFKDSDFITESGLSEYIDYDAMWEKEVISKIKILTDVPRWTIEERPDIDEW